MNFQVLGKTPIRRLVGDGRLVGDDEGDARGEYFNSRALVTS